MAGDEQLRATEMSNEKIKSNLCYYDTENPNNNLDAYENEDRPQPREECNCDNCFYGRDQLAVQILETRRERNEAREELERERGRLAVCGVVAMANTEESAKRARGFDAKYQSASCDGVARIVDSEMQLRRERDEALEKLRKVLKLLDEYDQAIKNPVNPFWDAFKKMFNWEGSK